MGRRITWIAGLIVGFIIVAAAAAYGGYRLGAFQLDSGISAVKFARIGLKEATARQYDGARVDPVWHPDGNRFIYDASEGDEPDYRLVDPASGDEIGILLARVVASALTDLFGEDIDRSPHPARRFDFASDNEIAFTFRDRRIVFDLETETASFAAELVDDSDPLVTQKIRDSFPAVWPDDREILSPTGTLVVTAIDRDIYLRDATGTETRLTTNGSDVAPWEVNSSLWSPSGKYIALLQSDGTDSSAVPVVDWNDLTSPAHYERYPTVASDLPIFRGVIVNIETGEQVNLDLGTESYIRPLSWRDDDAELLVARLSRDAKTMELLAFDPATGDQRTLLSETTDTYHMFPPNFVFRNGPDIYLLADDEHFIWISDRSGYRQLYLHDMEGNEIRQLTDAPYSVITFAGFDEDTGTLLYTAHSNSDRPYDALVHSVSMQADSSQLLSEADGYHQVESSPSGKYYVDKFSTTSTPPIVELRASDGRLISTLSEGRKTAAARTFSPPPEHFSALAADGETTIHGVIFKPAGFDETKSYPIVDAIYGGPFINYVPSFYDTPVPFFGRGLTELGYVVVVIDARGTPGRGKAFKDMIYGRLGEFEIADHAAAIRSAARERTWMDTDRVGILGHSYGGYFSLRALLQEPDFYKVAVASGVPEMDKDAVGISTEAYLGLYEGNEDRYLAAANAPLVDNLKGDFLLIIPTSDVNTPTHGPFRLIEALNENGKAYDVLILPGANHAFEGADRRYFLERVASYFQEKL
ncbi:MAG: DPP IV N-terminal domain-containing protein [Pseudomonadota bacterium]